MNTLKPLIIFLFISVMTLGIFTYKDLRPIPESLNVAGTEVQKPQLLDRHQNPITITYKNHWNLHDTISLHKVPEFLQRAFILSEDKRFYDHEGVDWLARFHAIWQNVIAFKKVRGASTITEQTIKMLHKRPRNLWTRWLEGFEANQLEKKFSKIEILEFYLNQVPYSAQRRGIVQAARYYFDRDLQTLNKTEMMMLAVLVRAPSRLDPIKHPNATKPAVERLAKTMHEPVGPVNVSVTRHKTIKASHFAKYIYGQIGKTKTIEPVGRVSDSVTRQSSANTKVQTTLDLTLQTKTQKILEQRLIELKKHNVQNGAVLIVDHATNVILSWVVAGDGNPDFKGSGIDAINTPRQPGSTLKPLLYTLALKNGFTAATLIDDSPLSESVGVGLHTYHNYSRVHYGPISLREALANSLNIPAVKTLQKVGTENFLQTLHALGINSLSKHPDLYGDGLALGNGEITLYELVQAYTILARHGNFKPLTTFREENQPSHQQQIFSAEASSLIANILSDPQARKREFGSGGLLQFPIQTAVKTGTSNDYRDAWAIGFNHKYTVGVWMGNMDRKSMDKITGSRGPALVLRSIFSELNKHQKSKPLYLSPKLVKAEICKETGLLSEPENTCSSFNEWFLPETLPFNNKKTVNQQQQKIRIQQPSPNLQLAMDPRIPDRQESFRFALNQTEKHQKVKWFLNEEMIAETPDADYQWALQRGQHQLRAEVLQGNKIITTKAVSFLVK